MATTAASTIGALIAQVATAVVIDGQRVVIEAGEPLPDAMPERDRAELLASRSARAAVNESVPAEPAADTPPASRKRPANSTA